MRLLLAIGLSAALHLLFVVPFKAQKSPNIKSIQMVEFMESSQGKRAAAPTGLAKQRSSGQSEKKGGDISRYMPEGGKYFGGTQESELGSQVDEIKAVLDAATDLENRSFIEEIARRINGGMLYPEEFVAKQIAGRVLVRIRVGPSGIVEGPILRLESGSRLLSVYAATAVSSALRQPLPTNRWRDKPLEIDISVNFQLQSMHMENSSDVAIAGDRISISKSRFKTDPLTVAYNRVRKYLPVLPLPGGFYIDFVSLYMLVNDLDKPSQSFTETERLRLLSERLDQMFEKQSKERAQADGSR